VNGDETIATASETVNSTDLRAVESNGSATSETEFPVRVMVVIMGRVSTYRNWSQ
jgi:hypothetical protein